MSELVVGIGMRPGTDSAAIVTAVRATVGDDVVGRLATVDRRATEPGLVAAAAELGAVLIAYSADELATVDVPNPSDRIAAAIGVPSVAEAAAILASAGGALVVPKTSNGAVTAAAARAE